MIFVTVGTHEQPFNRLVEYIDNMKRDGLIDEKVVIQTGYSTYEPQHCEWQALYPYQTMLRLVDEARIVITHGGPSSFIMPLQIGKTPIVVPRRKQFDEHVNDHQVEFSQAVAERMGTIITVAEMDELGDAILHYDEIVSGMNGETKSNNAQFNARLEEIVDGLMAEGKSKKKKR